MVSLTDHEGAFIAAGNGSSAAHPGVPAAIRFRTARVGWAVQWYRPDQGQ